MKLFQTRLPSPLLLVNSHLLHEMDLIPEGGEAIVDQLHLLAEPCRSHRPVAIKTQLMDVVVLPTQKNRQVVSIPHLPKFKALSTIRGDIRAMNYKFASSGRHHELWVNDVLCRIAAIRRAEKNKATIFGRDAHDCITDYLVEIQRRGVSLTQATDIVCSELGL
jgi:hypothetical protein